MEKKALIFNLTAATLLAGGMTLSFVTIHNNRIALEAEQARVALVAKQAQEAKVKAEQAAESRKLATCAKDNVDAATCDRYLEALAQIEDAQQGDSYGAFLDRQAQRNNDLAYCRQNPSDWSCTDGQYRGQY